MTGLPDLDDAGEQGWRRAALTLHALQASDRDWLLAQLDVSARERLQALLDELRRLAWPADRQLVQAALALPEVPAAAADIAALLALLQDEPDSVRQLALRALDRSTCSALLAAWPEGRPRPRLEPAPALPEALAGALRATLARLQRAGSEA